MPFWFPRSLVSSFLLETGPPGLAVKWGFSPVETRCLTPVWQLGLPPGCRPGQSRRLVSAPAAPSKPAPGRHQAIEAQIRDEIAVMQGVMISDLRQDEHLVRLERQRSPPGH